MEIIEIKIKDATIWQIRDVMLIHQGKRPECQRIWSLMNFWTLSHCRLWDDHVPILYDREILWDTLIWNKGRVWNNDTNYWKHYFNELAVHFNFYSAYLQVSLKNSRYLEVPGWNLFLLFSEYLRHLLLEIVRISTQNVRSSLFTIVLLNFLSRSYISTRNRVQRTEAKT